MNPGSFDDLYQVPEGGVKRKCEEEASAAAPTQKAKIEVAGSPGRIHVGSLAPSVSEAALRGYFDTWGTIEECRVIRDRATGISRGFAFLTFHTEDAAQAALSAPKHILEGRPILVSPVRSAQGTSEVPSVKRGNKQIQWQDIVLQPQKRIYVGPLHDDVEPHAVADQFNQFGVIVGLSRLRGSGSASKTSYAFIDYDDSDAVRRAFGAKMFVQGRYVHVALSRMAIEVIMGESIVFFYEAHEYCDEPNLEAHFSPLGPIFRCNHFKNERGVHKSFGFVDFLNQESVDRAISNKSQLMYPGQFVRVSKFLPTRYLMELLAIGDDEGHRIIQHLDKKVPEAGSWGGTLMKGVARADNPITSSQVRVPASVLPQLIGEHGKQIAELCRDSKTKIVIPKVEIGSDRVILTVHGTKSDIVTAQYLMQKIIKGAKR
eukprot:maker-scaffold714_size108203-snap-gene-0.18 protein:Tk02386 transcript:maker-scaffold714_size108203-snap-gene-0.18-mRNA-1 annotation:"heterogeneous nuclear ribonucleoprotein a1-like 3-like isoform 1"